MPANAGVANTSERASAVSLIDALSPSSAGTAYDVFYNSLTRTSLLLTALVFNRVLGTGGFGFSSSEAIPVAGGFLLDSGTSGAAGGGYDYPVGFWTSYQHSDFSDDLPQPASMGTTTRCLSVWTPVRTTTC